MSKPKAKSVLKRVRPEQYASITKRYDVVDKEVHLDNLVQFDNIDALKLMGAAIEVMHHQAETIEEKKQLEKEKYEILFKDASLATLIGNWEFFLMDPEEAVGFVAMLTTEAKENLVRALESFSDSTMN